MISGVKPGINVTTGSAGLYLGADFMGYYNGAAWRTYMDNAGNFYLGGVSGALQWNGTTLSIAGTITATAGTIGGWTIGSTTLTGGNATLSSTGVLILGTSNDVVYLSAADATYRLWVGNVTAGSAAFSVTKAGAVFAISGTVGGFTLASNSFTAGSGSTYVEISNNAGTGIKLGDSSAQNLWLVRGTGGTAGLYMFESGISDTRVGLTVSSTGYGRLTLSDTSGTLQFDIDSGQLFTGMTIGGDTNLYRSAANTLKTDDAFVAVGSVTAASFSGSGASLTSLSASNISSGTLDTARLPSLLQVGAGSASAPSFSFSGATNYGMYQSGSALLFSTGGTLRGYFDTSYNFVVSNGSVTGLIGIDTGSSRFSVGTTTAHSMQFVTNGSVRWFVGSTDGHIKANGSYDIRKASSDGWTVLLNDGSSNIEFQASGGQIFGRINGGSAILLG